MSTIVDTEERREPQEREREPWELLIGQVLARRGKDPAYTARLRRGVSELTEAQAYPYVAPYARTQGELTVLLRMAAIMAQYPRVPQARAGEGGKRTPSLGESCFTLSQRMGKSASGGRDRVATRLAQLPQLDVEQALEVFRRLVALANGKGVAFDFYKATKTFLRWGSGVSTESQAVRNSPLRDYYVH